MRTEIRAIGRSIYHHTRPPQLPSAVRPCSPPLPPGASCSRWYSCSHRQCHPASGNYFSPAQYHTSQRCLDPSPAAAPIPHPSPLPPAPIASESPSERGQGKAAHLPLPPPLPYSPSSVPFKRHLDYLSFALSTDADTSWTVYTALHPSLRRYVPNELYRALVTHQLDGGAGWERVSELVRFALECGMDVEELGSKTCHEALRLGLRHLEDMAKVDLRSVVVMSEEKLLVPLIWRAVVRWTRGDMGKIDQETRAMWLRLWSIRISNRGKEAAMTSGEARLERGIVARERLDEMIEGGGLDGIGEQAIAIALSLKNQRTPEELLEDLDRLISIHRSGWVVPNSALWTIVGRYRKRFLDEQPESVDQWDADLQPALDRLAERSRDADLRRRLVDTIAQVRAYNRDPDYLARAQDALASAESATIPQMIRRALKLILNIRDHDAGPETLDIALTLFERVAHRRTADPHILIAVISHVIMKLRHRGHPTTGQVTRVARVLITADLLGYIDAGLVHSILKDLVYRSATSAEAFRLARQVYSYARKTEPKFIWARRENLWRIFFSSSLHYRPTGQGESSQHIFFASRLYADAIADGQTPQRRDMLRLIKVVSATPHESRYILLERHLQDYGYFGHRSYSELVAAFVGGLTATRRPRDAWMGFMLARRVLGVEVEHGQMPQDSVRRVLGVLVRSGEFDDLARCAEMLSILPADEHSLRNFGRVFNAIFDVAPHVKGSVADPTSTATDTGGVAMSPESSPELIDLADRRQRLGLAITLYRVMLSKDLSPSDALITQFICAFAEADYLDHACKVLMSMLDVRRCPEGQAIRTVLVHLEMKSRDEEAQVLRRRIAGNPDYEGSRAILEADAMLAHLNGTQAVAMGEWFDRVDMKVVSAAVRRYRALSKHKAAGDAEVPEPTAWPGAGIAHQASELSRASTDHVIEVQRSLAPTSPGEDEKGTEAEQVGRQSPPHIQETQDEEWTSKMTRERVVVGSRS